MMTTEQGDRWQCLYCGEEFEYPQCIRPPLCPNPNCGKRHFRAMTGPFTFWDGENFVPKRLADKIMEKHRFATVTDTGEIYHYNDGAYHLYGEAVIQEAAQRELGALSKTRYVSEVVDYIKRATFVPREYFEQSLEEICCKNGILNLHTMEFIPHTPDKFFLNTIPVDYDPDAKSPEIEKFFREVLNENDIPVIEELIGYCLTRGYPIQKAVLFVGGGSNGKSVTIMLIKTFLGKDNISGRSLQDLEMNRFAKADLYGKLANLYPDLPDVALTQTGTFKMLTGGDPISGEHKFKGTFIFSNYAKLIFSANKVPEVHDESDAFFRRWIIINFPNKFEGEKEDQRKLEKLITSQELSGLLNLALSGLKRLLNQAGFSYSKTTDNVREEYIRKSSPVKAFVMDRLEVAPEEWIEKKELYSEFCAYCREKNYPIVAENTFHQKIQQAVKVEDYRLQEGDKRIRTWRGIRLIDKSVDRVDAKPVKLSDYVQPVQDVHAFTLSKTALEKSSSLFDSSKKITKIGKSVDGLTISDIQAKLWEAFGVNPFKPSEYARLFKDDELPKVAAVIGEMLKRGDLMVVPYGDEGQMCFQLVRRGV